MLEVTVWWHQQNRTTSSAKKCKVLKPRPLLPVEHTGGGAARLWVNAAVPDMYYILFVECVNSCCTRNLADIPPVFRKTNLMRQLTWLPTSNNEITKKLYCRQITLNPVFLQDVGWPVYYLVFPPWRGFIDTQRLHSWAFSGLIQNSAASSKNILRLLAPPLEYPILLLRKQRIQPDC